WFGSAFQMHQIKCLHWAIRPMALAKLRQIDGGFVVKLESFPKRRFRNQSYQRAQKLRDLMRDMTRGGTTSQVHKEFVRVTGEDVQPDPIEESLWHLHDLGLLDIEIDGENRKWKAIKLLQTESSESLRLASA
ncbi:MAG: hypothetical protein AAF664_25580, partial [Planctomycetota bacterium]